MNRIFEVFILVLVAEFQQINSQTCSQEGFFRNPDDCTKFYRCVDQWQNGRLTAFNFDCPAGTVFDENVSVCNWPQLAPPCSSETDSTTVSEHETGAVTESEIEVEQSSEGTTNSPGVETTKAPAPVDNGESVILRPTFSFKCPGEGLFAHATDCMKFWLCVDDGRKEIDPELYICPENYLYDPEKQRCLKADQVTCTKVPSLASIRLDPPARPLQVSELDNFFARWTFPYVINA